MSRYKGFIVSLLSKRLNNTGRLTLGATRVLRTVPIIAATASLRRHFTMSIFTGGGGYGVFGVGTTGRISTTLLTKGGIKFCDRFPASNRLPRKLIQYSRCKGPIGDASSESRRRARGDSSFGKAKASYAGVSYKITIAMRASYGPFVSAARMIPGYLALNVNYEGSGSTHKVTRTTRGILSESKFRGRTFRRVTDVSLGGRRGKVLSLSRS